MPRALFALGALLLLFAGGSIALAASGRGPTLGPIELLLEFIIGLAGASLLTAGVVGRRSERGGGRRSPSRDG